MKYSYHAIEAAALWLQLEPKHVADVLAANDLASAEYQMKETRGRCDICPRQLNCPEWFGYAEDRELVCPENHRWPPSEAVADYLPESKRYSLNEEERALFPLLHEYVQLLLDAIECGDLKGNPEKINHIHLREWMELYDPNQRPTFLFSESEGVELSATSIFAVIGALLEELEAKGVNGTAAKITVSEKLPGRGFSTRTLDTLFGKANAEFQKRLKKPR